MSVLIKGMDMPKNCAECLLLVNACSEEFPSYVCDVTGDDVLSIYKNPNWCPLVEVPTPHGRLIDADDIKTITVACTERGCIKHIDAPTVIESED